MGKNQLELFCTSGDLTGVLNDVQEQSPASFAVAGLFDTANIHTLASPDELLAFVAASGETMLSVLAIGVGTPIAMREVPQRNGRVRYAVDQLSNPRSVVLRPGRLIDDRTLLAGQVGTASGETRAGPRLPLVPPAGSS